MFTNRKKLKLQGKTSAHKKALVKSQVLELIRNEKIKTTPAKARLLKSVFDKLVTKAKVDSDHARRQVSAFFGNNERSADRLYTIIDQKLSDRTSGYTRVIKTLSRKGDNAQQCYVMLVNTEAKSKKSKISNVLQKQEQKKKEKSLTGKISKAVEKVSSGGGTKTGNVSTAKTRRNSK